VISGTAYKEHGSRFDPVDPNGIDRGGAINLISPHGITSRNVIGMAVSGCLVEVPLYETAADRPVLNG
jgi:hypothetical protein